MPGRNRQGLDDFYSRPRGFRSGLRGWFQRHPFITLVLALVTLGWLTWWEASRIDVARSTVAHGWGTGLTVGILASVGLTAVWVAVLLATRGKLELRTRAQWPLALILVISWAICFRTTAPPSSSAGGPYVITTGIEVGEIAYTATYSAWFMVLLIWSGVRRWRRPGIP